MKTLHLALACILTLAFSLPAAATTTAKEKCDAGKQAAAATHLACLTRVAGKLYQGHPLYATKVNRCDTRLDSRFTLRERQTPQDPNLDSSHPSQCSHYGDADNVKAYNAHVAKGLNNGEASTYGANLVDGNGERSDLDFHGAIPILTEDCGKEVRLEDAGLFCWNDAACEDNDDCCYGYYEKCKKKDDGTSLYECDPDHPECGADGISVVHDGNVYHMAYGWTYFGKVQQPIASNGNKMTPVTCRDGSPSGYAVSMGSGEDANKVVIRIEGGGACFNEHTCINSPFQYSWFWFADALYDVPWLPHILPIRPGVFDRTRGDNPFQHWTHVYIPHCTGDVGIGKNEGVYIQGLNLPFPVEPTKKLNTFQGWNNFEVIATDLIKRFNSSTVDGEPMDVKRYILAGDSAGGYGAMGNYIHFKELVDRLSSQGPDGEIPVVDVLDDSGAPLKSSSEDGEYVGLSRCLQERMWSSSKGIPDPAPGTPIVPALSGGWGLENSIGIDNGDKYCQGCQPDDFLLPMAKFAIKRVTEAGRYAGFQDSQYDGILASFFGFGNTGCVNDGKFAFSGAEIKGTPCLGPDDSASCDSVEGAGDGVCEECWQLDRPEFQPIWAKHSVLTPNQYQTALSDGLAAMWNEAWKHKPLDSDPNLYNFRYFILAGNAHATDQIKPFYTRESNGVRVVDWVADFVGDDNMTPNETWKNIWPKPVVAPDCRGSGDQCEQED